MTKKIISTILSLSLLCVLTASSFAFYEPSNPTAELIESRDGADL